MARAKAVAMVAPRPGSADAVPVATALFHMSVGGVALQGTVFIVDDDPAIRDVLKDLVESAGYRPETHPSAQEFLEHYDHPDRGRPGCIVSDLRMPGMSGLELQDALKAQGIDIPLVILTGYGDVPSATRSLKGGAVDFVQKPFCPTGLLDSIRQAVEKDAEARRRLMQRADGLRRLATLSKREQDVLELVMTGAMNKQIAGRLEIAERTVEDHRSRIMRKMGATSVPELVKLVLMCQLEPGTV